MKNTDLFLENTQFRGVYINKCMSMRRTLQIGTIRWYRQTFLEKCHFQRTIPFLEKQYTGFIIQYLKPKHVTTRNFHVFLHENSVKVINSLYTFFGVFTLCNHHCKQKVVKLISRE